MDDPEFMSLLDQPVNGKHAEDLALAQRVQFYTTDLIAKEKARIFAREELGEGGGPLQPSSLTSLIKEGVPAPTLLCGKMLYQAGLHSITGAPDSGKTTLALWWGLQLMKEGGRLLFLDEEGGPEIVAEKFIALGATAGDMENASYVPFPGRSWSQGDILALHDLASAVQPQMILWDSSAAFLARAGLDENQAPDVTNFWARVLTPLARDMGTAILVIDHDGKATEKSRYARGSGAKLAACDVAYKVEMLRPFTRDADGLLRVTVTKDRRGWLHRDWKTAMVTGNGQIWPQFAPDDEKGDEDRGAWPPARHKIYDYLSGDPRSTAEITLATAYTPETVSRELNAMLREGYVRREGADRDGRVASWCRLK
jgi:hypothetical protein